MSFLIVRQMCHVTKVQMNRISFPGLSVHQDLTFHCCCCHPDTRLHPLHPACTGPPLFCTVPCCGCLLLDISQLVVKCLALLLYLFASHAHACFQFCSYWLSSFFSPVHTSTCQGLVSPCYLLSLHIIMLSENIIVQANSHLPRLWICPSPVHEEWAQSSPDVISIPPWSICHSCTWSFTRPWLILTMSSPGFWVIDCYALQTSDQYP